MKTRVHNPKYLEKYFTQFPNIIDDSELSPFEYRLLIHYYRVGECWEGVRKTSEICKMSTGKVAECRKSLEDKGLISIEQNGDGIIITLVDLSKKNLEKYSNQTVHEVNTSVHEVNTPCSPDEHKKNQFKNNPLRTVVESKDSTPKEAVLGSELVLSIEQPNTKAPSKKEALYAACVDFWLKEAHPGWTFSAMHGKSMKALIVKMRTLCLSKQLIGSDAQILSSFKKMCQELPEWFRDKDLPIINAKFNEIITQIQNGNQPKSFNSKNSADRFSDYAR